MHGPSPGSWAFGGQQSGQPNLGWQAHAGPAGQQHQVQAAGGQSSFAQRQADNDREGREKEAMERKIRELEDAVQKLSALASEARSERGSSSIRVRRTASQRTEEWLRTHGVQHMQRSQGIAGAKGIESLGAEGHPSPAEAYGHRSGLGAAPGGGHTRWRPA